MDAHQIAWSAAVLDARIEGRGVVALESTVIAQGLPWPENLETARAAEAAVRTAGAVPATIAVFDGIVRVGLSDEQLLEISGVGATGDRPIDPGG
jgi:pseudouridine-5'-phosphate glycosidase